jgi:hypothetical protein
MAASTLVAPAVRQRIDQSVTSTRTAPHPASTVTVTTPPGTDEPL